MRKEQKSRGASTCGILNTKKQSRSSAYIRNLALSAIIFSLHARSGLKT